MKIIKYLGMHLIKEVKDILRKLKDNDERNLRCYKQMKRYIVLMD